MVKKASYKKKKTKKVVKRKTSKVKRVVKKASKKKPPAIRITAADRFRNSELFRKKEQEIVELRERAKKIAIKLKRDGISPKYITVKRICEELLEENFSSGISFESRWGSVEGMRSLLKGEDHPTKNQEFRDAKSTRGRFNA